MEFKEFLRNNPVFWSRLGFCYDPPLKNEEGKPLVFTENFDKSISAHSDFFDKGVKIHSCILHLGWMGVDEYDYSLTDRVLESVFSVSDDIYFIPRIKLNVPVDWCKQNPEEVFVYYGGPTTRDEIAELVGTEKQDYLGYDSPTGYYKSGDYVDNRPNVGGVIARQSFSSKKWLRDAGEALSRLIDRLENSKYSSRILGYHLAYGTSGETILWGRINKHYGDYGISNRRAFYQYGLEKYGSPENLEKAWCQKDINEDNLIIPSPSDRACKKSSLTDFLRGNPEDRIVVDYDLFTSEVNASALEYFAKTVKERSEKPVGAFYGYSLFIDNAAYTGHLALDKLLESPYVDFFASPKSYARTLAGEPGGEISPAQSINLSKLFVDELDNRTYLATETEQDKRDVWGSSCVSDTLTVMWREFAKDLSHNSGFWWMDLGGGWFADEPIMNEIKKLVSVNNYLRSKPHRSEADMLIVFDERSMLSVTESTDLHRGFLREFINETNCSGILADVYRANDLPKINLAQYKLIVFAYNFYMNKETRRIIEKIPDSTTLAFGYAAGAWDEDGFDMMKSEIITSHKIFEVKYDKHDYDFPKIRAEILAGARANTVLLTKPYMSSEEIRNLAKAAGCHIYTESESVTVYSDNRFVGVFNKYPGGKITLKETGTYRDLITGNLYISTNEIPLPDKEKSALFLVKES